jgi:putative spermidine/putrescine transport system ATP-binding protein
VYQKPTGIEIELTQCAKTYGAQRVLQPLDLRVRAGETLVLLGPSGCGKSTTLRLIAGLDMPDPGGKVLFDGQDVTHLPIEERAVGMVFQSYALFPNMTVRENVEYGLKVRRVDAAQRRARASEMMEMVEIAALEHRAIHQLSGGQRQRVALARAVAPQPKVLLLDEPLTALDARLRESLRVELDSLLRRLNTTAVYVTHDQAEAMALADRIVVMEGGRICQIGTPAQIYQKPEDPFVAQFIGSMNTARVAGLERMFRPEDAQVLHSEALAEWARRTEPAPAELLNGRVVQSLFLGERIQLRVQLEPPFASDQSPLVTVYASARTAPPVDERVALRVAADSWVQL